jgi:hypothetical protein
MGNLFDALQNRGLAVGQLVLSRAGHDLGRVYLVVRVDRNFIDCVDGDYRPLDKPKHKRSSHVKPIGELAGDWQDQLNCLHDAGQQNALIRTLIRTHANWLGPQTNETSEPNEKPLTEQEEP